MSDVEKMRRALQANPDPLGIRGAPTLSWCIADAAGWRFVKRHRSQAALDEWRGVVEETATDFVFSDDPQFHAEGLARRILIDACQSWLNRSEAGPPGPHIERVLRDDHRLETPVAAILAGLLLDLAWA